MVHLAGGIEHEYPLFVQLFRHFEAGSISASFQSVEFACLEGAVRHSMIVPIPIVSPSERILGDNYVLASMQGLSVDFKWVLEATREHYLDISRHPPLRTVSP
jgi:hypothetical protein